MMNETRVPLNKQPPRFWFICYNLILQLFSGLIRIRSRNDPDLQEALEGRRNLWERLEASLKSRNPGKPLVWFHVASAGEWLQAQPVIRRLSEKEVQCVLTYTSINARRWFGKRKETPPGVLVHEFIPLDTPGNAKRLLDLMAPDKIVWVSYDLWPNHVWEAAHRGIPQLLISGIVHQASARSTNFIVQKFYRTLYNRLEQIMLVSDADLERVRQVVPEHPGLSVMGDTRFDSVIERREQLDPPQWPEGFGQGTLFVAGSTWPRDEECIYPVLRKALEQSPELQLVLVPHEPTEEHLLHAETFFRDIPMVRWKNRDQAPPGLRILLIDTIGLLAGLYRGADIAYVGAGFTTGVHNTMEPASMGLPVFFGPRYDNALEAKEMIELGCAFSIDSTEDFESRFLPLLQNPELTRKLGAQAQQFIESQAHASEQCLPAILGNL